MKRKPSQLRRASTKIEAWRAQDESKSRYQPATSVVVERLASDEYHRPRVVTTERQALRLAGQEMKNTKR